MSVAHRRGRGGCDSGGQSSRRVRKSARARHVSRLEADDAPTQSCPASASVAPVTGCFAIVNGVRSPTSGTLLRLAGVAALGATAYLAGTWLSDPDPITGFVLLAILVAGTTLGVYLLRGQNMGLFGPRPPRPPRSKRRFAAAAASLPGLPRKASKQPAPARPAQAPAGGGHAPRPVSEIEPETTRRPERTPEPEPTPEPVAAPDPIAAPDPEPEPVAAAHPEPEPVAAAHPEPEPVAAADPEPESEAAPPQPQPHATSNGRPPPPSQPQQPVAATPSPLPPPAVRARESLRQVQKRLRKLRDARSGRPPGSSR